jgi:hypothetical protein
MNDGAPKPVPPLTARKKDKDRTLYTRFADVEAEIREVWCRPPLEWIALKGKLKNETVVCLICKAGLNDDYIRGQLMAELDERTVRIVEAHVKGFDDVIREEILLDVQGKIFNLVWVNVNSSQADYLEVAFADKVRDFATNAIKRYKDSVMGEREQLDIAIGKDAGEGAFAVVEINKDVLDLRRDQEEMLILLEDDSRQDELLQKIQDAVKDPRHFQAFYLFEALDKPIKEIADHFNTNVREIRYWKDTARHQIRVAFGIETEEKREALNKRRRELRAKRKSAQSKVRRRPGSQPPSLFI